MSVQSISSSVGSTDWLQTLLAMYGQTDGSTTDSTMKTLRSLNSDSSGTTAATSADASSDASTSSVGSFNSILSALLAGDGNVAYDMETGSLTALDAEGNAGQAANQLTTSETETKNSDGSTTNKSTTTDADGNVVSTSTTVTQTDGSYTSTITITGPDGKSLTRTVTGENTDEGFQVSSTLTDGNGNVWETTSSLTAADGTTTSTISQYAANGDTSTTTSSYDASGELLSATTSYSSSSASQAQAGAAAASTTTAAAASDSTSSSSATSGASGGGGGGSSSSDNDDTTTTVSLTFTDKGIEETTTVTDADGNIVSQSTKMIASSSGSGLMDSTAASVADDVDSQLLNNRGVGQRSSSTVAGTDGTDATGTGSLVSTIAAQLGLNQYALQSNMLDSLMEGNGLSMVA